MDAGNWGTTEVGDFAGCGRVDRGKFGRMGVIEGPSEVEN